MLTEFLGELCTKALFGKYFYHSPFDLFSGSSEANDVHSSL